MPERTEIISGHDGGPIAVWWRRFAAKHRLIAQFVMFYAFSLFVTILQYVMLTFLPNLFYANTNWCDIPCQLIHLTLGPVDTYVFDYPVTGDATGGMGYFAAFAITLFLAQCVNFPMQRNITFKSHGNVWFQIAWYVVANVLAFGYIMYRARKQHVNPWLQEVFTGTKDFEQAMARREDLAA